MYKCEKTNTQNGEVKIDAKLGTYWGPSIIESNLVNFTPNPLRDTLDKLYYEHRYIIQAK